MKIQLTADETKDLSRQLRFLYVRELRNAGFTSDDEDRSSAVSRSTTWYFDKKLDEIPNYAPIFHTESVDGEWLIREAVIRVEQQDNIVPRVINDRYVAKLREAVRHMAMKTIIRWKRDLEVHALRFVTHQEPFHSYMEEKILYTLWA